MHSTLFRTVTDLAQGLDTHAQEPTHGMRDIMMDVKHDSAAEDVQSVCIGSSHEVSSEMSTSQ